MNRAHLHLVVNHAPVLGSAFGVTLLVYAVVVNNQDFIRLAFVIFVVSAVAALAAYWTGKPAKDLLEHTVGVPTDLVEQHEEVAFVSLALVEMLGVLCLIWLFVYRSGELPTAVAWFALTIALFAAASMTWTAHLGGQIRHSEIRHDSPLPSGATSQRTP
jgi:hypothetical protein